MTTYFIKATDPRQYDLDEMQWKEEAVNSPMRRFFADSLERELGDLAGKSVLDVGSGGGYCANIYEKRGAKEYIGIEPSIKNVALSRKLHPKLKVIQGTLEDTDFIEAFDVAVSIMVFEHIADPVRTLKIIQRALRPGGRFYLLCGDKDVFAAGRFDYTVKTEPLANGELASVTKYPYGTSYDILRPIENYIRYAEISGLKLVRHIPLPSSESLVRESPKYELFQNRPFTHLLVFEKV